MEYNERINDEFFAEIKFRFLQKFGVALDGCDWLKVTSDGIEEKVFDGNERYNIFKAIFKEKHKGLNFIHVRFYKDSLNGWALTDYGFHFSSNGSEKFDIPYKQMHEATHGEINVDENGVIFTKSEERILYEKMIVNQQDEDKVRRLLMDIKEIKF